MRISSAALDKHFGSLGKMYGQYRFSLAPNEQKPFKGFFVQAIIKPIKGYIVNQWFYFLPPAVTSYLIYDWAKKTNHALHKKDPSIYANDV